jgi:hypothetical protein
LATAAGRELALELDPYRRDLPPAVARRDMWPLMIMLASVLFFGDVFVRRVQWDAKSLAAWLKGLVGKRVAVPAQPTLARLTAKKAEVRARYQPQAPVHAPTVPTEAKRKEVAPPVVESPKEETAVEETYTGRLLAAKRAAAEEHQRRGRR